MVGGSPRRNCVVNRRGVSLGREAMALRANGASVDASEHHDLDGNPRAAASLSGIITR